MDRIKEGIIKVGDVIITPETKPEELVELTLDKVVERHHPQGYLELIFNQTIVSDEVEFEVSVRIARKDYRMVILVDPKLKTQIHGILDESRMKQEMCEEWLKRNIDVPPTRDTDDGIYYDFSWGHIYCTATRTIHFGPIKGCIIITYGDDSIIH